jgi:hypothetical protein
MNCTGCTGCTAFSLSWDFSPRDFSSRAPTYCRADVTFSSTTETSATGARSVMFEQAATQTCACKTRNSG